MELQGIAQQVVDFFRNLSGINLFLLLFAVIILPPAVFVLWFRDLFFGSSFKYTVIAYDTPRKEMVLRFLNFPRGTTGYKFLSGKWLDNLLYKEKIVIVAGEAAPRVYGQDFYDRLRILKEANVPVTMLAGPVFLVDDNQESFALTAAAHGLVDLYVMPTRHNRHFRANLYTGELYFEYPHAPNEPHRQSVHFRENRYEVKNYIRRTRRMKKSAMPFAKCVRDKDYLLLSQQELEQVKQCIDINGLKDFNDYSVAEIQKLRSTGCKK